MQSFFYLKFNPVTVFESISNSFKSLNKNLLHQFTNGGFFGIITSFIFFFLNLFYPFFLIFFIVYYNLFNALEFLIDSLKGLAYLKYLFLPVLYILVLVALIYIGLPIISFIVTLVINILVAIWNFILFVIRIMGFILAWIWLIFKYLLYFSVIGAGIGGFAALARDSDGASVFWGFVIVAALTFFGLSVLSYLIDTYLGGMDVPVLLQSLNLIGRFL